MNHAPHGSYVLRVDSYIEGKEPGMYAAVFRSVGVGAALPDLEDLSAGHGGGGGAPAVSVAPLAMGELEGKPVTTPCVARAYAYGLPAWSALVDICAPQCIT